MKKKFRKNQIIITALAVMIAVAGYLSFTNKEVSIIDENGNPIEVGKDDASEEIRETLQTDSSVIADDEVVEGASMSDAELITTENVGDSLTSTKSDDQGIDREKEDSMASADSVIQTGAKGNSDDTEVSAPVTDSIGEAVLTSVEVQTPMNSDVIINAKLNREQTRSKSQELLMQLVNNESLEEAVKQNAVNELIAMTERMEKESVCEQQLLAKGFGECVVLINDDSVDVTVNRQELSEVEKAQIEDIITRKAECDVSKVVITVAQ